MTSMAVSAPVMPPATAREHRPVRAARATASTTSSAGRSARSARSVHFALEPVARDVQKHMERQLWHWLEKTHSMLRPLEASARGQVQVMERATVAATAATAAPAVVVKAVAVTLPPYREHAHDASEDEDISWSRAQLVPSVSLALWEQRRRQLRHVAGVVDVYTLASMLRDTREGSPRKRHGSSGSSGGAVRFCTSFLGSSCDTTASGRVPMPVLDADELREQGWALDVVLWNLVQERWGRERLPVTVMPAWVNTAAVFGSDDPQVEATAASALTDDALEKLRRHIGRWLKGASAADKTKKRVAGQAAALAIDTYGAAVAAAVASDEQALTAHDAADITWGVCTALARLHRAGLAHGNLKPNNVLIAQPVDGRSAAQAEQAPREVHVTDHLLPLLPDQLVEPGELLKLPWAAAVAVGGAPAERRKSMPVTMSGYVCLKQHEEAASMSYLCGGGLSDAVAAPAFSLSGFILSNAVSGNDDAAVLEGGVDCLSNTAYEAVLLQHLTAPRGVWVDTQHATPASDIYALGVLLYIMLIGRLPPLPRYRRASRGTFSAAAVGARPQRMYEAVVNDVVCALYENAARHSFKCDPSPMMDELKAFLQSAAAREHLPLVLALARAGVRPTTMDILVGMLHVNPAKRLSLAQLQHHAFFRTYGRRRHTLRAEFAEAARRVQHAAPVMRKDPLGHSVAAAVGRRMMPQNMGATAKAAAERPRSPPTPSAGHLATVAPRVPSIASMPSRINERGTPDPVLSPASPNAAAASRSASMASVGSAAQEGERRQRKEPSCSLLQSRALQLSDPSYMGQTHYDLPRRRASIQDDMDRPLDRSCRSLITAVSNRSVGAALIPHAVRRLSPLRHEASVLSQTSLDATPAARLGKAGPALHAPRRPVMRRQSAWMMPHRYSVYVVSLALLFVVRLRRRRERTWLLGRMRRCHR
ncbi:Protein kinase domain family protein [Leishmania donovani]|uniref:Protein kinase domain family protein n=1 Tax=Leishmania donovani TaxID=5661 RepID=A0A504XZS0_LEIDO|nr:Protein kinase domain family protein [Leishmania donovani]